MVSLVIPVYNEEILIEDLFQRVRDSLKAITNNFEVIFVDDGSTDDTLIHLKSCNEKDKRFKILTLSRNFGHQAAYTAGLTYAKGDYVAMMDGDLQDPPELIESMYDKIIKEDVDIVYAKRNDRNEKTTKRLFISIFHLIFKQFSSLENIKNVGNFSIMKRKALESFLLLQEKNRYLPGLRAFIGFKQGHVEYARPDRSKGEAKMSFRKLVGLAFDAIFSFSNLPVKICLYAGLIGIILIIFSLLYIGVSKITGLAPLGWSSIMISIYFIGSVQLLSIGVLGEYIFRIYKETQNRPIFFVRKFIE
jgi:glycosyltransferase involved in cell wall biosynthesis